MDAERHHHECGRCSYAWYGKPEPKRCPACKSPYWDKPRIRNVKKMATA